MNRQFEYTSAMQDLHFTPQQKVEIAARAAEAAQGRPTARAARAAAGTAAAMAEHRLDPVQAESITGLSDKVDKATGIGQMAA